MERGFPSEANYLGSALRYRRIHISFSEVNEDEKNHYNRSGADRRRAVDCGGAGGPGGSVPQREWKNCPAGPGRPEKEAGRVRPEEHGVRRRTIRKYSGAS